MTRAYLALDPAEAVPADVDEIFLWVPGAQGSFASRFDPSLAALGRPTSLNADFVRLAVLAWVTDRSVRRSATGTNWTSRDLELDVPVSDPSAWGSIADELAMTMGFLSGDRWSLKFHTTSWARPGLLGTPPDRTLLFSGGADSGIGVAMSLADSPSSSFALVAHSSSPAATRAQDGVVAWARSTWPHTGVEMQRINLRRNSRRRDRSRFPSETSSRSRSLLFLALGLAVASDGATELVIGENGFASINPPLGPERLGALSTRTTHPWFLANLSLSLSRIGVHAAIRNPYQYRTKGEMVAELVAQYGEGAASSLLAQTNSCSHTDQRTLAGVSVGHHCGVCFGCLLRRSAFAAGGLTDPTDYLCEHTAVPTHLEYVARRSIVRSVEDFVDRPITIASVGSGIDGVGLDVGAVLDLCRRGQSELRMIVG